MIELRKINQENFEPVLKLKLADGQENFVAPNIYSLAQAYVSTIDTEEGLKPPIAFAIYNNGEVIGFAMMEYEKIEEDEMLFKEFGDRAVYNFFRFMIDKKHQGKGLGKQAMKKILEFLRSSPQGEVDAISLSYEPTNEVARKLYASSGFVETGHLEDGEMVARLGL